MLHPRRSHVSSHLENITETFVLSIHRGHLGNIGGAHGARAGVIGSSFESQGMIASAI